MLWCVIPSVDLGTRHGDQFVLDNCLTINTGFNSLNSSFSLAAIFLITAHVIEYVPLLVGVVFLILRKTTIQNYLYEEEALLYLEMKIMSCEHPIEGRISRLYVTEGHTINIIPCVLIIVRLRIIQIRILLHRNSKRKYCITFFT